MAAGRSHPEYCRELGISKLEAGQGLEWDYRTGAGMAECGVSDNGLVLTRRLPFSSHA